MDFLNAKSEQHAVDGKGGDDVRSVSVESYRRRSYRIENESITVWMRFLLGRMANALPVAESRRRILMHYSVWECETAVVTRPISMSFALKTRSVWTGLAVKVK